jgi:hypothetical protein
MAAQTQSRTASRVPQRLWERAIGQIPFGICGPLTYLAAGPRRYARTSSILGTNKVPPLRLASGNFSTLNQVGDLPADPLRQLELLAQYNGEMVDSSSPGR